MCNIRIVIRRCALELAALNVNASCLDHLLSAGAKLVGTTLHLAITAIGDGVTG